MSIRSLAALALTVIASSSALAAEGSERKCGAGSCSKKGKAAAPVTVAQEASCSKKDAAKHDGTQVASGDNGSAGPSENPQNSPDGSTAELPPPPVDNATDPGAAPQDMGTVAAKGGGATDAFTRKYIFPGGYIPALSETVAASEKSRLIVTDVETLRLHYVLTLRQWYARTLAHRDEIVAMMDERFYRMWTFYLAGATAAFESGGMGNYQIQFARSRHALPLTRDYMAEAEGHYL